MGNHLCYHQRRKSCPHHYSSFSVFDKYSQILYVVGILQISSFSERPNWFVPKIHRLVLPVPDITTHEKHETSIDAILRDEQDLIESMGRTLAESPVETQQLTSRKRKCEDFGTPTRFAANSEYRTNFSVDDYERNDRQNKRVCRERKTLGQTVRIY